MRKIVVGCLVAGLLAAAAPVNAAGHTPSPSPTPTGGTTDPLALQIAQELQQQALIDAAKSTLAGEVAASEQQRGSLSALVLQEQRTIEDTTAKIGAAEQRLNDANAQAGAERTKGDLLRIRSDHDKALLADSIRSRYTNQQGLLQYVLSSADFSEMMSRAATVTTIVNRSQELLVLIRQEVAEADALQRAAEADAAKAAAEAAVLVAQSTKLHEQVDNENTLISRLSSQEQQVKREIQLANQQDVALVQQIANQRIQELDETIAKAEQADWDAAMYFLQENLGKVPTLVPLDPTRQGGQQRFIWPAPGSQISQTFGPSAFPFEPPGFGFPHFHTGIDMAAPMGTPIYAAADGVVVTASSGDVGYGNHIIIAHDTGTFTLYGHLQAMAVQPGATVHQGQLIGLMGSTGNSTGPHLHFEVRVNGHPTDPTPFLPPLPPGAAGPPALPSH